MFVAKELIITYGIYPFDICQNERLWFFLKILYICTFIYSNLFIAYIIYKFHIRKRYKNNKLLVFNKFVENKFIKKSNTAYLSNEMCENNKLNLLIGYAKDKKEDVYIPENGLYQNFLITGTIGSGKTSSAMYPFTEQLIKYNSENLENKIGMLILDVKGNYYSQVKKIVSKYRLDDDLYVIGLQSNITYNPLHKPNLKPAVLANRLKTILELFSENNSESYWLDKVEQILAEAIKLCRIYNDGYVTFKEIHKIVTINGYYKEKIEILKNKFFSNCLNLEQVYELNTALDFFQREFEVLDDRTLSILKSEITRITNLFISDYSVLKTFSPEKEEMTFSGFADVIKKGQIVVLDMNIAEYKNLSKIIAAYLKLDFQCEVMMNLSNGNIKRTAFICDEYSEYVTKTDSEFFSLSREAKCINIVSTQSYSSLKNTLKDDTSVKVICQNLINKIWYRTDDLNTIEDVQKQIGREEKEKISRNISENAKETGYNYIKKVFANKDSSISESVNLYTQSDYIFDSNYFTQKLETFKAVCFLSNGNKILKPAELEMYPYFLKK